ncbi:hypothetical protein OKW39_004500 [Paraburkholderia sp. MM6662-R1]
MRLSWRTGVLVIGCQGVLAAPASAQWNGHLATLSEAQLVCRNFDSSSCIPFLAEAVAVSDVLTSQADVHGDRSSVYLPGPNGSSVKCGDGFSLTDLNGEALTHAALTRDPAVNFYWSNAVFVAALDLCRRPAR